MKHLGLQLSICLLCITWLVPSMAQVTITHNNFPRLSTFVDSGYFVPQPAVVLPIGGTDRIWDYSSLSNGVYVAQPHTDASNDVEFENALNSFQLNHRLFIGGFSFEVPSYLYEAIDENGWYYTGRATDSMSLPLTALTGGVDDLIYYPQQKTAYVGRYDIIKFPMTYQSQWTGSYYRELHYELTAKAFGLDKAPTFTRTYVNQSREVIGHGRLLIPKADGTPSDPMEVLLIKAITETVDSFFIAGKVAPKSLTDGFGLSQGKVEEKTTYIFYKPDFSAPVLYFDVDQNNQINFLSYRPQAADVVLGVNDLSLSGVQSFPNPVSAGSLITIPLDQPVSSGQLRFFDLKGRVLQSIPFESASDDQLQVKIPESIGQGMFMYQILDKDKQPQGVGKLHVF